MTDEPEERQHRIARDEMNLAELPFATLARRPDGRETIVHETWVMDREGLRRRQHWQVVGAAQLGLPTEFDERVYVSLMKVSHDQGFGARRVPFSIYELVQIMGLEVNQRTYEDVELALKRLVGVTIYAENSFWDQAAGKWRSGSTGFHILEKYWLRSRETDEAVKAAEGCAAYIVWGEDVWKSFQAGYLKRLDLDLAALPLSG